MEIEWQRHGARLLISVRVYRPEPVADLTGIDVIALLDTVATSSGVSRKIADELTLPSIGKEPINTAGGTVLVNRYLARIGFVREGAFPFIFDDITAFELIDHGAFQAVLGMDVLARCDFSMTHTGRCSLRLR